MAVANPTVFDESTVLPEQAARALRLGIKAGVLLLACVALVHTVVLWWASGELQTSGFKPVNKVLYSRLIVPEPLATQALPVTPAAQVQPKLMPPKPVRTARAVQPKPTIEDKLAEKTIDKPSTEPINPKPEPELDKTQSAMSSAVEQRTDQANTSNSNVELANNKSDTLTDATDNSHLIAWPPSTKISYRLGGYYRGELNGSGSFEWVRDGLRAYQLFLRVRSLVGIEYRSQGLIESNVLRPLRYEEQLPRGVTAVSFNHDMNKVSFSRITDVIDMAPEMQDRASAIMQLVRLLTTDPERMRAVYERNERIKLNVANPTGADVWEFEVKGSEEVRTENANVQAWHLQRVPRKPNGDLGVDLWLSPQIKGMPVRIKLTTSADTYLDLIMTKAEQQQ
jgi:Protein of unknown function (DUF3108)